MGPAGLWRWQGREGAACRQLLGRETRPLRGELCTPFQLVTTAVKVIAMRQHVPSHNRATVNQAMWTPAARILARVERDASERQFSQQHYSSCVHLSDVVVRLATVALLGLDESAKPSDSPATGANLARDSGSTGAWVTVLSGLFNEQSVATDLPAPSQEWFQDMRDFYRQRRNREDQKELDAVGWPLREFRNELLEVTEKVPVTPLAILTWANEIRNKTTGHGAYGAEYWASLIKVLEPALKYVVTHTPLWAADLIVTVPSDSTSVGRILRGADPAELAVTTAMKIRDAGCRLDGWEWDLPPLIWIDSGDNSCYFANGAWRDKDSTAKFICHAVAATKSNDGSKRRAIPSYTLSRPVELRSSETEGSSSFTDGGFKLHNLPPAPDTYVHRPKLEKQLARDLGDTSKRHLINLRGGGGVGKTTLVLQYAHELTEGAEDSPYDSVVWVSARKVDLTLDGPRDVRRAVGTLKEVFQLYADLWELDDTDEGKKRFEEDLRDPKLSILVVVDNFETFEDQEAAYHYFDEIVRPPSKIVITSRHDFKGDHQIVITGMEYEEASKLILGTARAAAKEPLFTDESVRKRVFKGCAGHPYAMKLVTANAVSRVGIDNTLNRNLRDEGLLNTLFRDSINSVDEEAQFVFLTVSAFPKGLSEVALRVAWQEAFPENHLDAALIQLSQRSLLDQANLNDVLTFRLPAIALEFARQFSTGHFDATVAASAADFVNQWDGLPAGDTLTAAHSLAAAARRTDNPKERRRIRDAMRLVADADPRAYATLARLSVNLDDSPDEIDRAYKRAVEAYPNTSTLYLEWSECTQDSAKKVEYKVQAVAADPSDFKTASYVGNFLNGYYSERRDAYPEYRWTALMRPVAEALWGERDNLEGTDWSRLAWLELNLGDEEGAKRAVQLGLEIEPDNTHLANLDSKLNR